MKKLYPYSFLVMAAALLLSVTLSAQETKVTVKVEKDGKMVKDTTYTFDDADQADHVLKMVEVMSGSDEHMMEIHKEMAEVHGGHSSNYVFISEDGEKTEIKKMSGDSLVWISEGEHEGEHMKVMKYKVESGDHSHGEHGEHGEHVMVIKSGDKETYEILIDEDEDGGKTKKITVMVSDGEEGEWEIITDDGEEIDIETIIKEHGDGECEEVEVIVVKKKSKKQ